MARQKSFLCVFRRYSQAQLCVAQQGVEKEKKAGKEARAQGLQAATIHLLACRLGLGIWGRILLLYGTPLRASLEATGHDKPCVYKPDAMKRRRSERGKRAGGRGHGVPTLSATTKCCPEGLWVPSFTQTFLRRSIKSLCH